MCPGVRALIDGRTPPACVVVAELGVNHDGRLDRALRLLDAACAAGADAIKLQLYVPGELCSRVHRAQELAMLEALRLTDAEQARLCAAARDRGMPVFATPFDAPSLELLGRLEIPVVKIGSGEATHTPLLAAAARSGRAVILSTGGCTMPDVDRAVEVLRGEGCHRISLLHCVSAYPPPDDECHLRVLPALAERYPDCTVGFSDHTIGVEAAIAAVALGARIVEKHLTLDPGAPGPDHAASADPAAFAALVRAVRRVERLLGDGRKAPQPCEGIIGRSVVAARDLPVGHLLAAADLAFKRPGHGIRPAAADALIGRCLARPVGADELITLRDLA